MTSSELARGSSDVAQIVVAAGSRRHALRSGDRSGGRAIGPHGLGRRQPSAREPDRVKKSRSGEKVDRCRAAAVTGRLESGRLGGGFVPRTRSPVRSVSRDQPDHRDGRQGRRTRRRPHRHAKATSRPRASFTHVPGDGIRRDRSRRRSKKPLRAYQQPRRRERCSK